MTPYTADGVRRGHRRRRLLQLDAGGFAAQFGADDEDHAGGDEGEAGGQDDPGDDLAHVAAAGSEGGEPGAEGGDGEVEEVQRGHLLVLSTGVLSTGVLSTGVPAGSEGEDLVGGGV